jgi:hypothetical protein
VPEGAASRRTYPALGSSRDAEPFAPPTETGIPYFCKGNFAGDCEPRCHTGHISSHALARVGLPTALAPTRATKIPLGAPGRVALGSYPPRAPTDPYVLALERTVPRPTDSPSAMVPEAIRSSYGDMLTNHEVFDMFPSIESVGRRFASLHRVLRGEFPCFDGTIKALRLPAAHPAALRCLRLAVPRLHSVSSLLGGRVHRRGLELVTR